MASMYPARIIGPWAMVQVYCNYVVSGTTFDGEYYSLISLIFADYAAGRAY